MKTFDDLEFKKQPHRNAFQATCDLGKGLTLSVVYGEGNYSDVSVVDGVKIPESYEIAMFFGNDFVPLQQHDDVLGWQTPDHINKIMNEAQTDPDFVKSRIDLKHSE
jgi:hypothetical protein